MTGRSQKIFFAGTLVFLASLFFTPSNQLFLLQSLVYCFFAAYQLKNVSAGLFVTFLLVLPFAKGKSLEVLLIGREQLVDVAAYDVSYFFPVYLADLYLLLLFWQVLRDKKQKPSFHSKTLLLLIPIILSVLIPLFYSTFSIVILLSAVTLLKFFAIFFLVKFLEINKYYLPIVLTLLAGLLFQSVWMIMQQINGGPLGKYLEASLADFGYGRSSFEDPEFLRISGTFFDPNIAGVYLLSLMAFLLNFIKNKKKLRFYQIIIGVLLLGMGALIFTGGRILYILAIVFTIFILKEKISLRSLLSTLKKKPWLYGLSIAAFLILINQFVFPRLQTLNSLFSPYGSGTFRIQLSLFSLKLATIYPLGVGLNLSPYFLLTVFSSQEHIFGSSFPHNIFLQILTEMGVIGLIGFMLFFYYLFRPFLLKNKKLGDFGIAALAIFIGAQFHPIFLNHPELISFLFLFLGIQHYHKKT